MTPEDLVNEKKLSVLEEAAKEYENKDIFVLDGEYTKESVINAFIAGAEWQNKNVWLDIKKDGYPKYEKSNNLALKKYIVRAKCENMCIRESITISFLVNPCTFNVEMNSKIARVQVTHWMPIPEFNIKT